MSIYRDFHRRSLAERDAFWAEEARLVHWQRPFEKTDTGLVRFFVVNKGCNIFFTFGLDKAELMGFGPCTPQDIGTREPGGHHMAAFLREDDSSFVDVLQP